ncbi:MAG: phosphate signaling complex protein PhoU [Candidatus Saccharibacteria bacterium]|nr:phosphate signaling complex protein PhoU [Pseudorhodobacter sp.]
MPYEPHIRSAFDNDLDAVKAQVGKMGGLVEKALLNAAEALEAGDLALAAQVRADDRMIDNLEDMIQSECARIIALRAPTATDLRIVLTVMRMAGGLERSGDYAKNLAKRTLVLAEMRPIPGANAAIKRITRVVVQMLTNALNAYFTEDAVLAEEVRQADREVDQLYNSLFREFLTHMMEDPRNITACMHLHFIAKNIERVGDHASGIAEQVLYLVNGRFPEDERVKGDDMSLGMAQRT